MIKSKKVAKLGFWEYDIIDDNLKLSDEIYNICELDSQAFDVTFESFLDLIHPKDRIRVNTAYADSFKNKLPYAIEYRFLLKSGKIKYVSENCITHSDKTGQPHRSQSTILDITVLKGKEHALTESEKNHKALFESNPNSLWEEDLTELVVHLDKLKQKGITDYLKYFNENPEFIYECYSLIKVNNVNQASVELFNYDSKEDLIKNLPNVFNSKSFEVFKIMLLNLINNKNEFSAETEYVKKTGEKIYAIFSLKQISGFKKVILSITDITDRVIAENALKESEQNLKIANATKEKFFNIIAHDLKDPFNTILGFSEILLANHLSDSDHDRNRIMKIVNQSAKNAYKLLENLLTWSRSQSGAIIYSPEKLNLNKILADDLNMLQDQLNNKNIHLFNMIAEDEFIFADKNMISIIFRNLISNAIKFTPKDGDIRLQAKKIEDHYNNSYIEVSVTDNGIGISDEVQTKLFNVAENISAPGTEHEKGTGLGLILCKEFVEKHNGSIWVKSELKKGTTFYFTIPCKPVGQNT